MKAGTSWRLVSVVLLLTGLLSGCWDSISIADQAPVVALAVQPAKRGQLLWTLSIPNPTVTESSIATLGPSEMYYTLQVTADSLPDAMAAAQADLPRHLFFGQLEVVAWSSRFPLTTVRALLSALNDDGAVDKTFWGLTTQDPAALLRHSGASIAEPVPGYFVTEMFSCVECQAVNLGMRGWRLWARSMTPGISLTVPYAAASGQIQRLAVYGHRGAPSLLSPAATYGWGYITGRVNDATFMVRLPFGSAAVATASGTHQTRVTVRQGRLAAAVTLAVSARVLSLPTGVVLTRATEGDVAHAVASRVAAQAMRAITDARRAGEDPFGFTRTALWETGHWPSWGEDPRLMPVGHVTVHVTVRIVNEGIMP